jgi:zinc transport system substrate-binding protein
MYDTDFRVRPVLLVLALLAFLMPACRDAANRSEAAGSRIIVTSDTILASMAQSLLPPGDFEVSAIMPSDQCPGHYDIKLSDIEKANKADLVVSFRDLPFMERAENNPARCVLLDRRNRNWMVPEFYISGLNTLAEELAKRYPPYEAEIALRCRRAAAEVSEKAAALSDEIRQAGLAGRPVLSSGMQRESLEWMGLEVVGDYGRPESLSLGEVARLSGIGRKRAVILVADNLQSGPDAGSSIAEALGVAHVVLSNFPSGKGYTATLADNVAAVLDAVKAN